MITLLSRERIQILVVLCLVEMGYFQQTKSFLLSKCYVFSHNKMYIRYSSGPKAPSCFIWGDESDQKIS